MLYMLDTNICIFLISKKKPSYFDKLDKLQTKNNPRIAISTIVLAELQYGIANSQRQEQNQSALNILLGKLEILPYSEECTFFYGKIRALLKTTGCLIGGNDLLIASHAIAENAILITNNFDEFRRVDGLIVEHWE
jgi:tRNA(fMet)-specific endonuclease VapC